MTSCSTPTVAGSALVARAPGPALRRLRPTRPSPRVTAVLVAAVVVALAVLAGTARIQAAATATCTIGMPADATCGEALFLLGYP